MDTTSYLIISNVLTGVVLLMTCGVSLFRIRNVQCPFCHAKLDQDQLRTHIGACNEHNELYMGRFSPACQTPVSIRHEPLAVAVPLPPNALAYAVSPQNGPKIADI